MIVLFLFLCVSARCLANTITPSLTLGLSVHIQRSVASSLTMSGSPAVDLPRARELCNDIISSIASTSISRFAFQAPVIDRQTNLPYDNPLPLSHPPSRNETDPDSNAAAGPSANTKLEITANAQLNGSKRTTRRGNEALWKNGQHKGSAAAAQNGTGDKQGLNTWCQTEILGWNRFISGVEKQKAYLDEVCDFLITRVLEEVTAAG